MAIKKITLTTEQIDALFRAMMATEEEKSLKTHFLKALERVRGVTDQAKLIAVLQMLAKGAIAYQDQPTVSAAEPVPDSAIPPGYSGLVTKKTADTFDVELDNKLATVVEFMSLPSVEAYFFASKPQPQRQRVTKKAIIVKSRGDLSVQDIVMSDTNADAPRATIFAPKWVGILLAQLAFSDFGGAEILLPDGTKQRVSSPITLPQLHLMARNECVNCNGIVKMEQYSGIKLEAVLALKNLVTQTVVVCRDEIVKQGGYPRGRSPLTEVNPARPVIICDLSGLQFQQPNNTGWAVLIPDPKLASATKAPLSDIDHLMYHYIVGGKQASFADCAADRTGRYQKIGDYYFDTFAFQRMIAQDFVLAATAVNGQAKGDEELCFRFLKQGSGFFAKMLLDPGLNFGPLVEANIGFGVYLGLQALFKQDVSTYNHIKSIEFPFFDAGNFPGGLWNKILELCRANKIAVAYTQKDALEAADDLTVAVTNCADPHAPAGNEMRWGSVDAMIAENIRSKGLTLYPLTSGPMEAVFVDVVVPSQKMALAAAGGGGAKADAPSVAVNPQRMRATAAVVASASPAAAVDQAQVEPSSTVWRGAR